jgi:hypothetical protein
MPTILINSHRDSMVARDRLLTDLQASLPPETPCPIIIVAGGYTDQEDPYEVHVDESVTWIRARENAIDFTALLAVIDLYAHDTETINVTYMYLHDTSSVTPAFLRIVTAIDMTGSNTMRLNPVTSMNMGLYRQSFLNTVASRIDHLRSTGDARKDKKRCIEQEDWFFKQDPTCRVIGRGLTAVLPARDVYGTGVMRISEVYGDVGVTKYKANWHVRPDGRYELRN